MGRREGRHLDVRGQPVTEQASAGQAPLPTEHDDRPGAIHARPVRHPLRWVGAVVILVLAAMLVSSFVTNPRWDWGLAGEVMIQRPVLNLSLIHI